jgi:hypothetical protein
MPLFTLTDLVHGVTFHDLNGRYSALIIKLMNGAEGGNVSGRQANI